MSVPITQACPIEMILESSLSQNLRARICTSNILPRSKIHRVQRFSIVAVDPSVLGPSCYRGTTIFVYLRRCANVRRTLGATVIYQSPLPRRQRNPRLPCARRGSSSNFNNLHIAEGAESLPGGSLAVDVVVDHRIDSQREKPDDVHPHRRITDPRVSSCNFLSIS